MWIRQFAACDAAACAALFYRAVQEGARERYSDEARAAWCPQAPATETFRAKLSAQHCFVADDGAVQGFMSLTDAGYLDMAYVAPELRGAGVAAQLYAVILNKAHALCLAELTTHASRYAQPFFGREGWDIVVPEEVERNGVLIHRFAMKKTL
ncbi:MAG: GNAT family N-acetyltransferase [Rhodobacteraceae bacterium]|nr:GNAT family N-acetyltransferase [Paracoccaceae bacterium]